MKNTSQHRCLTTLIVLLLMFPVSRASATDMKQAWKEHCAKCHGEDGAANTKIGRKEKIKDLTKPRTHERLTDVRIVASMVEGIKDNDGREQMPSFKDKLVPEDMQAMVAFVRSLKR